MRERGQTPQPGGSCPVNYADAVDYALEQVKKAKDPKLLIKDRSVAILQVVRQLRNTCPGCGQSSEEPQLTFRDPSDIIIKVGEFRWHQKCLYKLPNGTAPVPSNGSGEVKDLRDTIKEQDQDLRKLVEAVLDVKMSSTEGYRLQVMASLISDKYTTWSESH